MTRGKTESMFIGGPRPISELPPRTIDTFRNEGISSSLTTWLPIFSLQPGEFVVLPYGTSRNTVHNMIERLRARKFIGSGYAVRKRMGGLYLVRDLPVHSPKLPPMFCEKLIPWLSKCESLEEGRFLKVSGSPSTARHAVKRLRKLEPTRVGNIAVRVRQLRKDPQVHLVHLSSNSEKRKVELDWIGTDAKRRDRAK